MPSSSSCFGSTRPGAALISSAEEATFGKASTSRMLSVPRSTIMMRSRPHAMPPCGGAP